MLDALSLCEVQETDGGKKKYTIRPEDKYPATIARIQDILAGGDMPQEAVMPHIKPENKPSVVKIVVKQLRQIDRDFPGCWDLALLTNEEAEVVIQGFDELGDEEQKQAYVETRRWGMLAADKFFQRVLRSQIGGGAHGGPKLMRIHTLNYGN